MKKTGIAIALATVPIPFSIFGAGHFFLKRYVEGVLFLIAGWVNLFLSFLYLPFEFDSLMGPNFLSIISEFSSEELMWPILTMTIWSGLIASSIVRVEHLSKTEDISVKQ